MQQPESIVLNLVEGSSSKTYQVQLVDSGETWVVNYQHGRIGSTLKGGTKTAHPLNYVAAKKIYDALVREKVGKGYTPNASGTAYTETPLAGRLTDAQPMLLNAITADEAKALIYDDAWCMEIKFDGERRLTDSFGDGTLPVGINRKGLLLPLATVIAESINAGNLGNGLTRLDGEDMGDSFVIFDVLSFAGCDLRKLSYSERLLIRGQVAAQCNGIRQVITARTTAEKLAMFQEAKEANHEGVVFKRLDAPYSAGRPNSGGPALKFKFYERASVRTLATSSSKRSVGMEVMDAATAHWQFVGNVTIPPNAAVPPAGTIIDVNYLYAFRGGALYQPSYCRPRTDLDASACSLEQLKFKRTADEHGTAAIAA